MDFNSKSYQIFKLKKYIKKNEIFFLFHCAKLDSVKWTKTEQSLKKLNLEYYKPLNKVASKTLKTSIFNNLDSSMGGFLLFVNPIDKKSVIDLSTITKSLKPSFVLIGVKLNNKIYSKAQLKNLNLFSYNKNMFELHKTLDKYLKSTYRLTNKKEVSK